MRFHHYLTFLQHSVNAHQAKKMADVADKELRDDSTCLYGRYENGQWHNLSSYKKDGDTHKMLGYMGAPMRLIKRKVK